MVGAEGLKFVKLQFDVEAKNRLSQKGILRRFSIKCYGKQPTLEEIRANKSDKFKELKNKMGTKEYDMWFLKYIPSNSKGKRKNIKKKSNRTYKKVRKNRNTKKKEYLF